MNKKMVLTAICCAVLTAVGCGSTRFDSKETAAGPEKAVTAVAAEEITSDGQTTTEKFTIPSREAFDEIPAEAEVSFDRVIKTVDKNFPKAKKSVKRYYGYLGEQQVDGTDSYVFAIYDSTEDGQSMVATAAVTNDNNRVYILNEDSAQFWLLEQYSPERVPVEYSWTVTAVADSETTPEE